MTAVTVTCTVNTTVHYWFCPVASEDITGLGVTVPAIAYGWFAGTLNAPESLSVALDNAYAWNVELDFKNAPPVLFDGFQPGPGGDLLTLLAAQGWVAGSQGVTQPPVPVDGGTF